MCKITFSKFHPMADSTNSSVNSALCCKESPTPSEESSWTMYFEDFLASEERRMAGDISSSVVEGSSMISDAASCAAWKPTARADSTGSCKKLRLKKRRAWVALEDDPLEDTASSPVYNVKFGRTHACALTRPDLIPRKKEENRDISKIGVGYGEGSLSKRSIVNEFGLVDRKNNECIELKKKGVCLVPFSMLVDYLG
ncbi:vascular-related unknown protein 4-like isoform X1 [Typha angustifolia]|uniref:vascular-related unknown protein 4-like isoform X1 n=1 Tax=Typha angustifolia TaxID=59011 RepID=UPI003C2F6549